MSNIYEINERFTKEKNNYLDLYNACVKRLENSSDTFKRILIDKIKYYKGMLDFIRPVTEEDIIERNDIILNYADKVKNVIPDDIPYVFHGNSKFFL